VTRSRVAPLLLLAASAGIAAGGDSTDDLIARERVQESVDAVMAEYAGPVPEGATRVDLANAAVERLLEIGPAAVPHLVNELDREDVGTFDFAAFALGRLGGEEAEAALRRSLSRAHQSAGDWARTRKAWTAWALGLMGRADALKLVNEGHHGAGTYSIHGGTSVLEAIALQTAPDCIPVLLEELGRDARDEKRWKEAREALRALGRVGDASLVPAILPHLRAGQPILRREAAGVLGKLGTADVADALLAALGDEDVTVRRLVAGALEELAAPGREAEIARWLEKLEDPHARGSLYRWLALTDTGKAFDLLAAQSGREHPQDRAYLIDSIARIDHPSRREHLKQALYDPATEVALAALPHLARAGDREAAKLMAEVLPTARWSLVQAISPWLARTGTPEAGPAIADRLLQALAEPVTDAQVIVPVQVLGQSLVSLGYTEVLDELRVRTQEQDDQRLRPELDSTIRRLEAIAERGESVARWRKETASEDAEMRKLAYARLGQIGGSKAAKALADALAAAPRDESIPIVQALGETASAAGHAPIERILLDPAYDDPAFRALREAAGWSARKLGGAAMLDALARAVERRGGQDAKLTVYAALLGGEAALPLIRDHRRERMRHVGWNLGAETEKLDWIAGRIARGLPLDSLDREPELLQLR
jgi:HEAT repeat protein